MYDRNNLYNIPKVFYAYWDGNPLSYLQYLTVVTFQEINPDWKVVIYMPVIKWDLKPWKSGEQQAKYTGKDYLEELFKLDIEVRKIDFETIGIKNEIPEVIKSDYIRYWLMGTFGGLWSDMDIIYTKYISEIYDTRIQMMGDNNKIDTVICYFNDHYPVGFFMSKPNNPYFLDLYKNASRYINPNAYQCIGCCYLNDSFKLPKDIKLKYPDLNVLVLPERSYLPYAWNRIDNIFLHNFPQYIESYTIGIHWFNGSQFSVSYENLIDQKKFPVTGSIYPYVEKYFTNYRYMPNSKKISIVMAYYNRKPQILFTLKTIQKSKHKNFEIIIVDDCSDPEHNIDSIEELFDFDIKLIKISKEEKTWINPCRAYNIGIKQAIGDIIMLQNPEVCHLGDCIKFVHDNLQTNQWLTFNCYGLGNYSHNEILYDIYETTDDYFTEINKKIIITDMIGGNSVARNDVQGWLSYYPSFYTAYHYCSAIYRDDLINKMNGGFCEDYQFGIAYDDNDFIKYLIHNQFQFVTTNFTADKPFVIHQFHDKPKSLIINAKENHRINSLVFQKRMAIIGASTNIDIEGGFTMPTPLLI